MTAKANGWCNRSLEYLSNKVKVKRAAKAQIEKGDKDHEEEKEDVIYGTWFTRHHHVKLNLHNSGLDSGRCDVDDVIARLVLIRPKY